ncbi:MULTISPECIES: phosphate ABC transporter permease PstA [Streptomyces]|uniref:Phosphate transport system permease protein PstA n=1 Tax=Streptomyces tsukubensis (strain DSM 42081 / NBRC 108919 / NRRL 18488 / 9993) TaxID=1114943 RepID=I2N1A6_STRT9|nr:MULTISPECIES: phosphate ABC transporter permease PstA [Streptomyces]AZK94969.1 phosphate ABC transporter, permease protein PstA [Streptomyces tsukubensis]EIF90803.1 phosphate ABC transporter, permease protein PstA [Streptomyces tsukubensis NRRL18488]MYS64863.1 phosphate ABC transporter permease PstA [Streptomyces sp. SID5473]QKM68959.1 phosphate ABC transporter permease PtsA [Streptomyces tsukubensis NRRL18488]TAI40826.1 phosphate ABC transporter permease PstA [Streptomyces tsukubensis]
MSQTATKDSIPAPASAPAAARLTGRSLPRWAPAGFAAAGIALGCGLGAAAGWHSKVQWALLSALFFMVISYAVTSAVENRRQARDKVATSIVWVCFVLAVIPLFSLIWVTVSRGIKVLDGYFLTHSMAGVPGFEAGGGVYHALVGTLQQVGLAALISVPVGLLTAIYLVEYGRGALAKAVTFFVDVMTGIPSIVAGLFLLSIMLMFELQPSGLMGALALAILMLPVVVRSTEEMLKLVPNELREASLALGVPKWRTILKVVVPTALGGITTGVMLAVARIAGETAPIMLLVFGSQLINTNPFEGAQSSLPFYIWEQYRVGSEASYDRAWAAALVLIAFVMLLNLVARGIARWKAPKTGR